jgi:hypothetical protein
MDKLNKNVVEYLQRLIKTCILCGIDSVSVESNLVRGQSLDNSKGTFLLEYENIPPSLGFSSIGIGRVKTLSNRISILDSDDTNIFFEGKEKDNGDIMVKKLQLTNKKTKIDFSCYDSLRIKAPKAFNDPMFYEFSISEDTLKIMSRAIAAIDTTSISFSTDKDGSIKFRTTDVEGDIFDHLVSESCTISDDADKDNFFYAYEIKYILPLFKASIDTSGKLKVNISRRGIMRVIVNGFSIYVLPEA